MQALHAEKGGGHERFAPLKAARRVEHEAFKAAV